MSKPDDISHEVWNAAEAAFDLMLCNCIEASGTTEQLRLDSIEPLARAILAERERCANIAKLYTDFELPGDAGNALVREFVAKSIKDAATAIATSIEEGE